MNDETKIPSEAQAKIEANKANLIGVDSATINKEILDKELPEADSLKPFNDGKVRAVIQSRTHEADKTGEVIPDESLKSVFEPIQLDIQKSEMKDAESKGLTWKFEGETYPLFLANKTGNIAMPIPHPVTNEKMGVLGANFAWQEAQPFLSHLSIDLQEVSNLKEDLSTTKRKNLTKQNVNLYTELIQDGFLIKIKDGEESEPIKKNRDAMLSYPPEIQSDLIDKWLGSFYIERHFPEGFDELDALLGQADTIYFKCKIGDVKNPAQILLLGFAKPSDDARRDFEDNIRKREYKQEGDTQTTYITINHKAKLNFAKKHIREAQGAAVQLENGEIVNVSSAEQLKALRDGFCPQWFIRLGDALHDTFGIKK